MAARGHSAAAPRLHLGCGPERLSGWVNLDRVPNGATDDLLVAEASGRGDPDAAPWPEDDYEGLLRDLAIR